MNFNFLDKIGKKILSIFIKKEKLYYPPHFLRVSYTSIAKYKTTLDEFNSEIYRIKDGKLAKIGDLEFVPYTQADLEELKKRYNIPVVFEKIKEDEEYEFDPFDDLDMIVYKG